MKQKKVFVLVVACIAVAFTAGCKNVTCPTCENYSTLQGTIMDAITGERIGGVTSGNDMDIEIYLVQGATFRKPTSFISDVENVLVGEYSFTEIPSGGTDSGDSENNEYKLVVIKKGYQRFEGKINLVDIDNKIGNVYLFPEGYNSPDYTFQVVYNGAPVANATVLFKPVVGSNVASAETSDVIAATPGYVPSYTAETDASGQVTFAGAPVTDGDGNVTYPGLPLGAAYKLIVLPTEFEGVQLAYYEDVAPRIIGLSFTTDIISLADLAYGNKYGLYVKSISNSLDDQVVASGTLTMVFSRPVTLTGDFAAIETSPTGVLGLPSADAALSADGLTLTLTPNWLTDPDAGEHNTAITYLNGLAFVSVQGYPDSEYDVFGAGGLVDANGDLISGSVVLTTPE